jgi:hypothetical protein
MTGEPYFLPSTTFRPLGPSVTRTAFARTFTPLSIALRASSLNFKSFATFYLLNGIFDLQLSICDLKCLSDCAAVKSKVANQKQT